MGKRIEKLCHAFCGTATHKPSLSAARDTAPASAALAAAALALVLTAALPVTAAAAGPGEIVHGGPGDTAPARNSQTVYDYPGFKGAGPGRGNMVVSWNYDEWGPAGPSDFYCGEEGEYTQGWRYSPDGWWYQYAAVSWPAGGWKCIDSRWYFFEETGHLKTGWLVKDGIHYYLNPVDDGSFGAMRTGWQGIDGRDYYFNMSSQGVYGALLVDTVTPDGYQVGPDGARSLQGQ